MRENYRQLNNYWALKCHHVVFCLQDRVSLLPQVPEEAAYFWTDPTLSSDTFTSINVDKKGKMCNNSIAGKIWQGIKFILADV